MRGKPSQLSDHQLDSLEIGHFIFHIIDPSNKEKPVYYLDEVTVTHEQISFFTDRLKHSSSGTQYVFRDETPALKEKCGAMLVDPDGNFIGRSREIAAEFAGYHRGNMAPGVLVVAVVRMLFKDNDPMDLAFLVKLDHKDVYRYLVSDQGSKRHAELEKVTNSLVEDKAAVQKSALIDISERFQWDVLAFDRKTQSDGEIPEYFRNFLGVRMREDASELTKRAYTTVGRWARSLNRSEIPDTEDANTYRERALRYLEDHSKFNSADFLDSVVRDDDPERKEGLEKSLRKHLSESGITGQTFACRPASIAKKKKKNVYKTHEGITISFEGTAEQVRMTVKRRNPQEGQNYDEIVIRTETLDTDIPL
ncbi:MAG: nucleoid-associated protein [Candidatus Thiodiazotropha lotti]|nr:nucleoid-associated protein [Candidatus Thiodiazotropha lotti]